METILLESILPSENTLDQTSTVIPSANLNQNLNNISTDNLAHPVDLSFSDRDGNFSTNRGALREVTTDVHRFFNTKTGVHFYTPSKSETNNIIANPDWNYNYEGVAYEALSEGGTELYRFYNAKKGYHFLTASAEEADSIIDNSIGEEFDLLTGQGVTANDIGWGYTYEGRSFRVSTENTKETSTEVHRFWNSKKGVHFYSSNLEEVKSVISESSGIEYANDLDAALNAPLIADGWGYLYEGIAWYATSDSSDSVNENDPIINPIVNSADKITGISNRSILDNINGFLSDDLFSHQELKTLLIDVANGGVTSSEFNDLSLIKTNLKKFLSTKEKSYQSYIFDAVVSGNTANQWWTGGESNRFELGNLYEGSTERHLNLLIDKWYGGLDRPTNFVQGDTAADLGSLNFDYYEMVGDLFIDGISASDIRQGQAGTCYVLAAACSYANSDSNTIAEMFRDNKDGTYGVRFYDNSLNELWVTVDSYVPSTDGYSTALAGNSSWSLTGEKWVALMEKGYAQANETGAFSRGDDSRKNSFSAIEGGLMDALTHLSGEISNTVSFYYSGTGSSGVGLNDWTSAWGNQNYWNTFETRVVGALNSNKALWLGSFGNTWAMNGSRELVAGHAFAITNYNESTGLFTVMNPWGSTSSRYYNHTFTISWEDLSSVNAIVSWS